MKAALVVLVVVTVAVAVPMRMEWLELEKARPITKTARLGDVFSFCSEFARKLRVSHMCVYNTSLQIKHWTLLSLIHSF